MMECVLLFGQKNNRSMVTGRRKSSILILVIWVSRNCAKDIKNRLFCRDRHNSVEWRYILYALLLWMMNLVLYPIIFKGYRIESGK